MLIEQLCARRAHSIPAEAASRGHGLLLQGGYIHQEAGGIFTLSPLGFRMTRKITAIVREEMDSLGFQEILMPVVTPAALWRETGRLDAIDVLARFKGRGGQEYVLSCTHEEACVDFVRAILESYRQLPVKLYHVQTKFRDELRVRAGLLRVREFTMKDAYSLHASQDDLDRTYDGVVDAYRRIFARVGFRRIVNVRAHGGDMKGTKTDEFMLPNALGEDILYLCRQCGYGVNRELGEISACPQCGGTVDETKGIELGHVFQLERFYTERMNCAYSDESGARRHPLYASYGIGIGRTLGAIAEESAIEGGFVWPAAVAPFAVHLCALAGGEADARALYETLRQAQIDAILDARPDVRVGEQFADADLIGAPLRVVTGGRTPAGRVEVRLRRDNSVETPELSTAIHLIRRALKS